VRDPLTNGGRSAPELQALGRTMVSRGLARELLQIAASSRGRPGTGTGSSATLGDEMSATRPGRGEPHEIEVLPKAVTGGARTRAAAAGLDRSGSRARTCTLGRRGLERGSVEHAVGWA